MSGKGGALLWFSLVLAGGRESKCSVEIG